MGKVIMVGDSSVGKSSIVVQLCENTFKTTCEATVGSSYVSQKMETTNGPYTLHIWDTAGQERFRSIIPMYSRGCAAALLTCSVDLTESIAHLQNWLDIIYESCRDARIVIVINKIDIEEPQNEFIAVEFAQKHELPYYKTSAKDHESIVKVFQDIAEELAQVKTTEKELIPTPLTPVEDKHGGCC